MGAHVQQARGGDRGGNCPPHKEQSGPSGDMSDAQAPPEGSGEESQAPREDNRAVRDLIDLVELILSVDTKAEAKA